MTIGDMVYNTRTSHSIWQMIEDDACFRENFCHRVYITRYLVSE